MICQTQEVTEVSTSPVEYISLKELARRTETPLGSWYHKSRIGLIPGQVKIGRLVRVNYAVFERALEAGEVE